MNIGNSGTWQGFTQTVSGSGSISITGKVVTVYGAASSDAALLNERMYVEPGETITVSVLARQVSGDESLGAAKIAISYPTLSVPRAFETIKGSSFKKYSVTLTVPHTHTNVSDIFNVIIGNFGENDGDAEITEVTISSSGSTLPAPRVVGMGMVTISGGVAALDDDYRNQGVQYFTQDTAALFIHTDWVYSPDKDFIPLVFITHDQGLYRNVVITGNMDRFGLGRVYVTMSESDTGVPIDPSTLEGIRFSFIAMV